MRSISSKFALSPDGFLDASVLAEYLRPSGLSYSTCRYGHCTACSKYGAMLRKPSANTSSTARRVLGTMLGGGATTKAGVFLMMTCTLASTSPP
eukprot:scaffold1690_cov247-Pinguiococcus_pyrenoidosus.AAC.4